MATPDKRVYVEKHPEGYKVLRPGAERASAIEPTQQKAIDRAKEIVPGAKPHIERVRHTNKGHPDQFRKE